jgi:hypothetical protein
MTSAGRFWPWGPLRMRYYLTLSDDLGGAMQYDPWGVIIIIGLLALIAERLNRISSSLLAIQRMTYRQVYGQDDLS